MDIVLNDYSFNGQFESVETFVLWIQREWMKPLDYLLERRISVYKRSDFYTRKITKEKSMQDLLQITGDPLVSKIKSFIINSAFSEPYWDISGVMKTDLSNTYQCPCDSDLPNCFSEAVERDKVVFSIRDDEFCEEAYPYCKNNEKGVIRNIVDYNSFLCWLLETGISDVKYVFENYRFSRKITFVEIDGKCYAEEAIKENELTVKDIKNILINITELIRALSAGAKSRFWDSFSDGIFEYRMSVSAGREFRLLFIQDGGIHFLNGYIKKGQRPPQYEIDKAKKIKATYLRASK